MSDRDLLVLIAWICAGAFVLQLLIAFVYFVHLGRLVAAIENSRNVIPGDDDDDD